MKPVRLLAVAVWLVFSAAVCLRAAETPPVTIKHSPQMPRSGEAVAITFDGGASIQSAQLEYQIVLPGSYVALKDASYAKGWTSLEMRKLSNQFSVQIPGSVQNHRTLVRYRIHAHDAGGKALTFPPSTDTQPNYAYFVYDGIPGWKAALNPNGDSQSRKVVQFPPEAMSQVQSYFVIAKNRDVENITWNQQTMDKQYRYTCTFVADGKVYDHVPFRARGGVWRFAMGKNMWKFNFNKGHHLQAKDDYGNPYHVKWGKLNLRACIQQGDYGRRGEQGMYESVGFRLFNLAGVESPRTHWVSLRMVGEKEENPSDQFRGDFWGLYLAIENEDEDFLKEHNLPDGNLYKMMFGQGELGNKTAGKPEDHSDLDRFQGGLQRAGRNEAWWRKNVDLPRYYSYRAIVEGIHHYDIADGKNYDYFFDAKTGKCTVIPWDIDLTWADHMYGGGHDPFMWALSQPTFRVEFQNRLREIRDLLFNRSETDRLIDECAMIISRPGALSIVDADRFKWDYHPMMGGGRSGGMMGGFGPMGGGKAGQGRFYQAVRTHDFAGMVAQMKEYVDHRANYIDNALSADPQIPATPTISYTGPKGFPLDQLSFKSSPFQGSGFAASEWRIGQIDKGLLTEKPKRPGHYEITALWDSGEIADSKNQVTVPAANLKSGDTYRVRCRMKDSTGRWSHWSGPVEFTAAKN